MTPLLAALALAVAVSSASAAPQEVKPSEPILVVPFQNASSDARLGWVSEAAALLLTRDLGRFGAAAISRDERLKAFERLGLPPSALLSQATIIRVGQLIGASYAVVGSYRVEETRLVLGVRTIRLDSGSIVGEIEEQGRIEDLFSLTERLARRMVAGAGRREPAPAEALALPAFELYVKGLVAETPAAQVRLLEAALAQAPDNGAVRLALWQVHTARGEHERALAAVSGVPSGSPLAPRARFLAALSEIARERYDSAFDRLKALADETQAPPALNNLGVVQLRRTAPASTGRPTYYFTKAADLAPEDPDYAFNVGYAYWFERDTDGAVYWLREAVRRNPADGDAHYVLGVALQAGGAQVEGEREKELARQLSSKYAQWQRTRPPGSDVPRGLERLRLDLESPRLSLAERAAAPAEQRDVRELAAFHRERGQRLFESHHDVEAMGELGRSLYLLPYQADVHLLVGRIHQRAGRLTEAAESFRLSLWCQATPDAHVALGEILLLLGDTLGARTEANRALTMDVDHAAARALLAKTTK